MADSMREAEAKELSWGWWLLVLVGVLLSVMAGRDRPAVQAGEQPRRPSPSSPASSCLVDGILELVSACLSSTRNRGMVAILGVHHGRSSACS